MPDEPPEDELKGRFPPAGHPYGLHNDPGGPGLEQDMEDLREEAELRRKFRRAHQDDGPAKRPWWQFWKR